MSRGRRSCRRPGRAARCRRRPAATACTAPAGAPGERRRPGRGHEVGPAAPDLDELGEDRERDLLGGLGAEVQAGRGAQRGEPLLGERRSPRGATRGRRRPGSARRRGPTYATSRVRARPRAPPRPRSPWVATTTYGRRLGVEAARGRSAADDASAAGKASASAIGSNDGHAPARPPSRARRARRRSGSCRRPTGPARADAVPRRSPGCRRNGRS